MKYSLTNDDPRKPASVLVPDDLSDDLREFFSNMGIRVAVDSDAMRIDGKVHDRVLLGEVGADIKPLQERLAEWDAHRRQRRRDEARAKRQEEE